MKGSVRHAFAAATLAWALPTLSVAAQPTLKSRTFQLTYRAAVKEVPSGARSLALWLPYPQTDANQTIHRVTVEVTVPGPGGFFKESITRENLPESPTEYRSWGRSHRLAIAREKRFGNRVVYVRVDDPKAPVEVTMEILATRRENAGLNETLTPEEARAYLRPEPLVPTDGPIRALALEATRGLTTDAEKARAIYEKVTGMMKYDKSGTGWGRGDALWACDAKRGNCTDFHALIIGMARAVGIPARFAIGLPLPEQRGQGEIPGYHCWAELYVKGRGWVPVDSSEAAKALAAGNPAKKDYFYGHHDENRLELSRGRHLRLEPPQQGPPLNFFVYPYVEIDGKPYDRVERRFTFADQAKTLARR